MSESGIFKAAVKLAANERAKYLDEACGANSELRREVESLLKAHESSESFLEASPAAVATIERQARERPGLKIGRYKLLEQIGEGGMGTVWVAEQMEPVKRRVALKLIKPGMDSRQVLSRFEAERQALALMDHPNIAKVYDGGMTDEGRPFFVMEYVKGMPITEYCENARLSIQERLKLFIPVCQAVQHAHQKGVIHRDLKPSNILICLYDGQPVPKVIDFGLAKAMHQPLTEHTLYTAHGLMVGTPIYMSPEQAEFNNLDVDTRTDIYSLGVILYELLTGTTPLEKKHFKDAAFQEILRLIKDVEPQRPSLKLSTSVSLPAIAAQRSLEPAQLSRAVRGDLDWIVMKSLEKERSRRYESASGLARDVERFLENEPIHARPPSAVYRLRKFATRNKAAVAAALLIAASLVLGITVSTWQAILATRARQQTARELIRAVKAEEESADNLRQLQQVAREWATSETLTGDPQRAESAIRLAEAANVSKAWTEILRAQSEVDQGLHDAAVSRLSPMAENAASLADDDLRLAVYSVMAYAHILKGGGDVAYAGFIQRANALQRDPGPEAGMFKAMAEIWFNPEDAISTLDAAIKKRPYPACMLIRANALSFTGGDLSTVEKALQDLSYFRLFAGPTSSLFIAEMNAHLAGFDIAQRSNAAAASEHLRHLSSAAIRLEQLPRTLLTATYLDGFYYREGRLEKIIENAKRLNWGVSPTFAYAAANLYELSLDPSQTLILLNQLQIDDQNPSLLQLKAHLFAESPETHHEVRTVARQLIDSNPDSPNARFNAAAMLHFAGFPADAKLEAQRALEHLGDRTRLHWGIDQPLRFLSGEWAEDTLRKESESWVVKRCSAHYILGVAALAKGDRQRARREFEGSVATGAFASYLYYWSEAYLARMSRDPNWPAWIEKKTAAE
jgi:serine/threonine protein kinase